MLKVKEYVITAKVDAKGVYFVSAGSPEEAEQKFNNWNGGDDVVFDHYSEEYLEEILSVEENK